MKYLSKSWAWEIVNNKTIPGLENISKWEYVDSLPFAGNNGWSHPCLILLKAIGDNNSSEEFGMYADCETADYVEEGLSGNLD